MLPRRIYCRAVSRQNPNANADVNRRFIEVYPDILKRS